MPPGSEALQDDESTSAINRLVIDFTGGAAGEALVVDAATNVVLATCTSHCKVDVTPGRVLQVFAATPSRYEGISGACETTTAECSFRAPAGLSKVRVTFVADPSEQWTRLLGGGPILTTAFDHVGDLLVGANRLTKLSPQGATRWTRPIAVCGLAIARDDSIYAQTATDVIKLDTDGALVWSEPLHPHAIGCGGEEGFVHNVAVGPDDEVAIQGDTGVARWDASGTLSWAVELAHDGVYGVAIDSAGNVAAAMLSPVSAESLDIVRWSAAGAPLAPVENLTSQYHGMFVFDATDRFVATASGHSHTDLLAPDLDLSVDLDDADYVPTGVSVAATGDIDWIYHLTDDSAYARNWVATRYRERAPVWSLERSFVPDFTFGDLGTIPLDIAADGNGRLAIVGSYNGLSASGGWVQVFAP